MEVRVVFVVLSLACRRKMPEELLARPLACTCGIGLELNKTLRALHYFGVLRGEARRSVGDDQAVLLQLEPKSRLLGRLVGDGRRPAVLLVLQSLVVAA